MKTSFLSFHIFTITTHDIVGPYPPLNDAIRKLHETVGNAKTDGKLIVLGSGATQLFNAAMYAYSKLHQRKSSGPLSLFAKTPYYFNYPDYPDINPEVKVWNSSTAMSPSSVVEICTHPNNPDNAARTEPHYETPYKIHDLVYYWPHLCAGACTDGATNVSYPLIPTLDEDMMVFSFTKMTGHAGTRFGWAIVEDPAVALLMTIYIAKSTNHPSVTTIYRARYIIESLLKDNRARSFFGYGREVMLDRHRRIYELWDMENGNARFPLRHVPNGAYIWLECLDKVQCTREHGPWWPAGVWGSEGKSYGQEGFFRINLTLYDSEFEILINKLRYILRGELPPDHVANVPPPSVDDDLPWGEGMGPLGLLF